MDAWVEMWVRYGGGHFKVFLVFFSVFEWLFGFFLLLFVILSYFCCKDFIGFSRVLYRLYTQSIMQSATDKACVWAQKVDE